MSFEAIAEALVWFSISTAIAVVGLLAALLGIGLCYFRGTRTGRTPIVCAFLVAVAAVLSWLIFAIIDSPCSGIFAISTSLATFMAFAYWFSRYDRN